MNELSSSVVAEHALQVFLHLGRNPSWLQRNFKSAQFSNSSLQSPPPHASHCFGHISLMAGICAHNSLGIPEHIGSVSWQPHTPQVFSHTLFIISGASEQALLYLGHSSKLSLHPPPRVGGGVGRVGGGVGRGVGAGVQTPQLFLHIGRMRSGKASQRPLVLYEGHFASLSVQAPGVGPGFPVGRRVGAPGFALTVPLKTLFAQSSHRARLTPRRCL